MTKQEYYDLLVTELTQPSRDPADAGCRYRLPDGRKCAIGLLIPDERYLESLEGHDYSHMDVKQAVGENIPEGLTYDQLGQVQRAHDYLAYLKENFYKPFVKRLNELSFFKDLDQMEVQDCD